jgi:cytidylate kinase
MIIAIDGPAGAGKSTVARVLSARLGFSVLDTGALYRATALASMRSGREAAELVNSLDIRLGDHVLLDGEDVTAEIRRVDVTDLTHRIAEDPRVRDALTRKQRDILHSGDWIADGRDIGTVVAPDAEVKVFLSASLDERAARRAREIGAGVDEVKRQVAERDARDEAREHSPLIAAEDAVLIDSSTLTIDEVVAAIIGLVPESRRSSERMCSVLPGEP